MDASGGGEKSRGARGNRPDSAHAGLRQAIRWHEAFIIAVEQARLAHPHRLWAEVVGTLPGYRVLTPSTPGRDTAIGLFNLEGIAAKTLSDYLMGQYRLFTTLGSASRHSG